MRRRDSKNNSLVEVRGRFEEALDSLRQTLDHDSGVLWKTGAWTGLAVALAVGFVTARKARGLGDLTDASGTRTLEHHRDVVGGAALEVDRGDRD